MAVLSVLSRAASRVFDAKTRHFCSNMTQLVARNNVKLVPQNIGIVSRSMGGDAGAKRLMKVLPTRYEYNVFKDQLHFYLMLGIIPLGAVILYSNFFIGQATLTDIPEGYQPERWEYYKHPIQRFFAKFYTPPEMSYEMTCHHLDMERKKKDWKLLERRVTNMMKERNDYRSWYYVPLSDRRTIRSREVHEDVLDNFSMPEKQDGGPAFGRDRTPKE